MSSATLAAPAAAPPRSTGRTAAFVAVAVAGPLAIALLRGILPYDTTDEPAVIIDKLAAAPGATTAVVWLAFVALLTLPLGVLVAGRLAVATRPVLGTVAAVLAWVGFVSLFAVVGVEQLSLAAADAGVPLSTVVALEAANTASPLAGTAIGIFVIGHILGAVLLGVALWRAIPRWAALALIVSQPLHLLFAVGIPNHLLDALAWSLTGVGFAAAALAHPAR